MQYLERTLPTIAENLALEEALLEEADAGNSNAELLRIWAAQQPFVVLGRSSRVDEEVDRQQAEREQVPIYRRVSGGATVLAGPGCLFYAVLLSLDKRPQLRMLDEAHRWVMGHIADAVRPLQPEVEVNGTCDLVIRGRKVGGNSLRLVRHWMLYHGSLLLDVDAAAMDRLLKHPPREPEYRQGRQHSEFVTKLNLPASTVAQHLRMAWKAHQTSSTSIPQQTMQRLVRDRYSQSSWNFQR
ncbi:MAG: hypothetical protein KDA45_06340 [Planctomycetales bacterium]|nr:hypothetical protein [Planctomycetales bacterium]